MSWIVKGSRKTRDSVLGTTCNAVDYLIDTYDLHASIPVRLEAIEPLFCPERRNLSGTGVAGMVILPRSGPISESNFARVLLSDTLSPFEERLVYAHEVAHVILGHPGELMFEGMDRWFVDKSEREAWQIAARLLVPVSAVVEHGEVQSIASACRVPPDIVHMAMR